MTTRINLKKLQRDIKRMDEEELNNLGDTFLLYSHDWNNGEEDTRIT